MPIRYNKPLLVIFIIVNTSLEGQGGVIEQVDTEGHRYPARFKSGVQSKAKRNYNTYKREYKGVIYLLKKFRYYLYRVHFILETNTKTLVTQLNRSILDLLISLITRQLIQLYLFDFKVRHVPGKKNIVANILSRRPRTGKDKEEEEEVERFLDTQLAYVRLPLLVYSPREKEEITNLALARLFTVKAKLAPIQGDSEVIPKYNQLKQEPQQDDDEDGLQYINLFNMVNSIEVPQYSEETNQLVPDSGYSDDLKAIVRFLKGLIALTRPRDITIKDFRKFKDNTLKFTYGGGYLFRKSSKNILIRRVIDDEDIRKEILEAIHK